MTINESTLRDSFDPGNVEAARRHTRAARYDNALELLQGCEDWSCPYNE